MASTALVRGLSPLTRGNHAAVHRVDPAHRHIPAHAGDRAELFVKRPRVRPIPAHAGQSSVFAFSAIRPPAYPRSRGEINAILVSWEVVRGLSPLTRGSHSIRPRDCGPNGPIPAHAGKPFKTPPRTTGARVYPRSRGETGARHCGGAADGGLSPLTRRNPRQPAEAGGQAGPIPAHAGKPLALNLLSCTRNSRNGCEILRSLFSH